MCDDDTFDREWLCPLSKQMERVRLWAAMDAFFVKRASIHSLTEWSRSVSVLFASLVEIA